MMNNLPEEDSEKPLVIRIDLKKEDKILFNKFKKILSKKRQTSPSLLTNTDTIRESLRISADITDEETIRISSEYLENINRLLKSPQFRRKTAIKSLQQFVDRSISEYFKVIEKEQKSLKRDLYEVLAELNPINREVAMTLYELNQNSKEVFLETILKNVSHSKDIVIQALNELTADGYINFMEFKGKKIYWST